jgi:hypothetical protein
MTDSGMIARLRPNLKVVPDSTSSSQELVNDLSQLERRCVCTLHALSRSGKTVAYDKDGRRAFYRQTTVPFGAEAIEGDGPIEGFKVTASRLLDVLSSLHRRQYVSKAEAQSLVGHVRTTVQVFGLDVNGRLAAARLIGA